MRQRNVLLSLSSGLLLWLAWPPLPLFVLLFVGLVPILFVERNIANNRGSVRGLFIYSYLAFFVWNVLTTWWVWVASPAGVIGAVLANAALMCLPIMAFHSTKRRCGERVGYISLPIYWMAFEFLHHQWELAWPWLSLGNGFAEFPQVIQWYEVTGMFGGTLWIWLVNLAIFFGLRSVLMDSKKRQLVRHGAVILLLAFTPILISLLRFHTYRAAGQERSVDVVVVQPNIDAYHEKFPDGDRFIPYEEQVDRLLRLTEQSITPQTRIVAWPETALPGGMDVDQLDQHWQTAKMRELLTRHPQVSLITGIDGYTLSTEEEITATSRETQQAGLWIDYFNTAVMLDTTSRIQHYHKSKLVPGVERMPYPKLFGFLERWTINLGGISGSLGLQDERTVFTATNGTRLAPVICFESVFGEYVGEYVRNGAELICVITNDGWWGTTAGHKQHLVFSSIRAIETRRDVVRSANTGISCFVDQRGMIRQPAKYGVEASLAGRVLPNDELTFYTRHGDYIAKAFLWLSIALLLLTYYLRIRKQEKVL